jgi:hypothetical protein
MRAPTIVAINDLGIMNYESTRENVDRADESREKGFFKETPYVEAKERKESPWAPLG